MEKETKDPKQKYINGVICRTAKCRGKFVARQGNEQKNNKLNSNIWCNEWTVVRNWQIFEMLQVQVQYPIPMPNHLNRN